MGKINLSNLTNMTKASELCELNRIQEIPWGKWGRGGWGIHINRLILKTSTQICKSSLPTLEVVDLSFNDLCNPRFPRVLIIIYINE